MGKLAGPLLILLVLNWCAWVIILGGVAANQSECEDNKVAKCGVILSLDWWTTWFQFLVLVLACLLVCAAPLRRPTEYLTIMVTVLMMVRAYSAYETIEGLAGAISNDTKHATQAYMAGLCLAMTFNILWLFVSSLDSEDDDEEAKPPAPAPAPMPAPLSTAIPPHYAHNPMYVQTPSPQPHAQV